jgi:hypothetical protein
MNEGWFHIQVCRLALSAKHEVAVNVLRPQACVDEDCRLSGLHSTAIHMPRVPVGAPSKVLLEVRRQQVARVSQHRLLRHVAAEIRTGWGRPTCFSGPMR